MTSLFWVPLLVLLWVHAIALGLLMFAPNRVRTWDARWPRVMRAIERGQMLVTAFMLFGAVVAVTALIVWSMLGLPGLAARG
jgi:hypothetical protein